MAVLVSPGVLTREIDLSLYVPALSTTILGIVATATKGQTDVANLITDVNQLEKAVGTSNPNHPGILVAQWYLKYGHQLRFVRVANQATLASASIDALSAANSAAVLAGTVAGPFLFTAATPGTVTGTEVGPYAIVLSTSDTLKIAVDGGGDQTVTLTAGGAQTAQNVVDEINAQTTGLTASISSGKVKLTSNTSSGTSSIQIKTVANNAYTVLGLTVATYTGTAGTDSLIFSVSGGGNQTIFLGGGALSAAQVAAAISGGITGVTAASVGNKVVVSTTATGSAVSLQCISTSTADTVLGFSSTIVNGTDAGAVTLTFAALTPGTWGNDLKIKISDSVSYAGTKIITVYHKSVPVEVWRNVSKNANSTIAGVSNYILDVINGNSDFIEVVDHVGNSSNPVNGSIVMVNGNDGLAGLSDADFIGTIVDSVATGLQLFADGETMDLNLVAIPGQTSSAVHAAMISLCEARGDAMCICDPPLGLSPAHVVDFANATGAYTARVALNTSYGAMYYPWVKGYDPSNQLIVDLPPSAAAIRTYIYNDTVAETWFAPGFVNRGRVVEAVGIERTVTQGDRDFLYENNINPIANFPRYGVVIWGQKTLQRAPTALDRVNVRRLLLYTRKVIATAVFPMVGEPNTPSLWRRFIALVEPTLSYIKDREGLNDFKIVCDSTTNTSDVIDRSEFRARIGLKPTKAAEFVIIDFVIVNQSSTFSELVSATF